MEKERERIKKRQKMPFLGGKQCFFIKDKERKGTPQKNKPKKQIRRV